jgi:hypothetical protein
MHALNTITLRSKAQESLSVFAAAIKTRFNCQTFLEEAFIKELFHRAFLNTEEARQ